MTPVGFRLLTQLGAGADGVAYRAEAPDGSPAEVRVLDRARADAPRWEALSRRLRRVALLHHPAARPVAALDLAADPPYVALPPAGGVPLAEELRGLLPLAPGHAARLLVPVADALAESHRLGLAHGALGPTTVLLQEGGGTLLDFTGADVGVAGSAAAPAGAEPDPAGDVAQLGGLLHWLFQGGADARTRPELPGPVADLLGQLRADDPGDRPGAREAAERLRALAALANTTREDGSADSCPDAAATAATAATDHGTDGIPWKRLGRFRLLEKLGEGGMGAVYRAEDVSDGRTVAVKLLKADWARDPSAVRRFRKEGRLLAEVNNPYVTALLEINEDQGVHYLALEFVSGSSLDRLLARRGRLDEAEAVGLAADVARGLIEAHRRGIVHRDIKPDNILLVGDGGAGPGGVRAKLSDFGLARHVVQSESLNVTRTGAVLGTPLYMSPEQCRGEALGPPADVYSLGATLFHLLAGRPPFSGGGPAAVIDRHLREPPPALQTLNPAVSDGAAQVVARALAKAPESRQADAGEFLRDLERLLRGEPTGLAAHPRKPDADPARVLRYDFTWELAAPPERLWPHVSNTERFNRAVGLGSVWFTSRTEPGATMAGSSHPDLRPRTRRYGEFHRAGLSVAWEEHPYEWVEARRMGVLREYSRGPFKWLLSAVGLEPHGGGTRLTHHVEVEPRGVFGRALAHLEVGLRSRRSLERVYRRIDDWLRFEAADPAAAAVADPFGEAALSGGARRARLRALLDELVSRGVAPAVADRLGEWVASAPPQEAARVRPLALAARLGLDPDALVAACLHGARAGLFVLLWDVVCPLCRVPGGVRETLRALAEHEHCPACAADFAPDFASSVELIFRVHPEVRPSELATYCVGGPAHSPHVAAQARVAPGERVELALALPEGDYRLRGPQLPHAVDFRVRAGAGFGRLDLALASGGLPEQPPVLRPGGQVLVLSNGHPGELVVRVERTARRSDALTAARASSLALFRELFPDEVLSPGRLVSVSTVTLLVTDLGESAALYHELGDARAFAVVHEHFCLLGEAVRADGGAVVKTVGEGLLASFPDAASAVRAALALPKMLAGGTGTAGLRLRAGVHRGPALAATVNDQLDYFGTTVRRALALPPLAGCGEVVLTREVAAEPVVDALLRARGLANEVFQADLPEAPAAVLHRVRTG